MMHRFEIAGLGKAPFRCIGFYVSKFQAIPGDPNCPIQPGSSCDYCSNAIMNVYQIRGADGREFKVGCDCVAKTGDAGLRRQISESKRAHEAEFRAIRKGKKMIANAESAEVRHGATLSRLDRLAEVSEGFAYRFASDVALKIRSGVYKDISGRQVELMDKLCRENGID